jgi:hypothetical protein
VDGELGPGCLAERQRRAGVIDVVMGQDDPIEWSAVLADVCQEPKHRSIAAGVSRIDDSGAFPTSIEVGLGATNTRDRLDHPLGLRILRLLDPGLRNFDRCRRRELDIRLGSLRSQLRPLGIADPRLAWIRNDGVGGTGDARVAGNVLHG